MAAEARRVSREDLHAGVSCMIMLGAARDDEIGKLQKPPSEVGGVAVARPDRR